MSEQHDEESLRRWAREQAEIERQTDALVLRTLTAMVTAAEDLKSKLRRDTETILEEFRRSKRGLENEISLSGAERQRFRREAEQERDEIVAAAKVRAKEIIEDAERDRDDLLTEVRSMEQRLRSLQEQIRSFLGTAGFLDPAEESAPVSQPTTTGAFVPAALGQPAQGPAQAAQDEIEDLVAEPPGATPVAAPPAVEPAPDEAWAVADSDEDVATVDEPVTRGASPPPVAPAVPRSAPQAAPLPRPAPAGPRTVELVFDGVPGYQQASVLERAVNDLLPGEDVDIVDFEQGQLVLNVKATDLAALADQLVAALSASLELEGVAGDRATFRCL
jgi:cell division septum initiation protein DivIVA